MYLDRLRGNDWDNDDRSVHQSCDSFPLAYVAIKRIYGIVTGVKYRKVKSVMLLLQYRLIQVRTNSFAALVSRGEDLQN